MATIITAENDKQLNLFDTDQGAKTGRWCALPMYPDRCNCFDPKTFIQENSTHYYLTWRLRKRRRQYYRHGACAKCAPKDRKLHKLSKRR